MLKPGTWSRKFPPDRETAFWSYAVSHSLKALQLIFYIGMLFSVGVFVFGAFRQGLAGLSIVSFIVMPAIFLLFTAGLLVIRTRHFVPHAGKFISGGIFVLAVSLLALALFGNEDGRYVSWVIVSVLLIGLPVLPGTFWTKVVCIFALVAIVAFAKYYSGENLRHVVIYFVAYSSILIAISYGHDESMRTNFALMNQVEIQSRQLESILRKIYPAPVFERVRHMENPSFVEGYERVSVMFIDLVGFTGLTRKSEPAAVVNLLDELFSRIDALCNVHGAIKIKTIGDAYLAVSGMDGDRSQAAVMANLALDVREAVKKYSFLKGLDLSVRIGVHCGQVVGGVIGRETSHFDLWGETVNIASRLESAGVPGRIQVSEVFAAAAGKAFRFSSRGPVELKGVGTMSCMFLDGTDMSQVSDSAQAG
jgi:class 3 adenylate cyclase